MQKWNKQTNETKQNETKKNRCCRKAFKSIRVLKEEAEVNEVIEVDLPLQVSTGVLKHQGNDFNISDWHTGVAFYFLGLENKTKY